MSELTLGKFVSISQRVRWIEIPPDSIPNNHQGQVTHWPGILYKTYNEFYRDIKSKNTFSTMFQNDVFLNSQRKNKNRTNDFMLAVVYLGHTYKFIRFEDAGLVTKIKKELDEGSTFSMDDDENDTLRIQSFYPYYDDHINNGFAPVGSEDDNVDEVDCVKNWNPKLNFQRATHLVEYLIEQELEEKPVDHFVIHHVEQEQMDARASQQSSLIGDTSAASNKIISPDGDCAKDDTNSINDKSSDSGGCSHVDDEAVEEKTQSKLTKSNPKRDVVRSMTVDFQKEETKHTATNISDDTKNKEDHNISLRSTRSSKSSNDSTHSVEAASIDNTAESTEEYEEICSEGSQFGDEDADGNADADEELVDDNEETQENVGMTCHGRPTPSPISSPEQEENLEFDDSYDLSPIRNGETWIDVWTKLKAMGWNWKLKKSIIDFVRAYYCEGITGENGFLKKPYLTEEELKEHVRTTYGWSLARKRSPKKSDKVNAQTNRKRKSDSKKKKEPKRQKKKIPPKQPRTWGAAPKVAKAKEYSPLMKLSFHQVWTSLKSKGWTHMRAPNPLHNWYYLKPAVQSSKGTVHGIEGVDYFIEENQLLDYVRKNLHLVESPPSSPESEVTEVNDLPEDDDKFSECSFETSNDSALSQEMNKPHTPEIKLNFKRVWEFLKREKGWTHMRAPNPLHDWYYLKPHVTHERGKIHGEQGQDYFITCEHLLDYIKENMCLLDTPNGNAKSTSNEEKGRDEVVKKSPKVAVDTDINAGQSHGNYSTPNSYSDDSSNSNESCDGTIESEWWMNYPIPSFKKEIYPLLRKIIPHKSGCYVVERYGTSYRFERVEQMRIFFATHGLEIGSAFQNACDDDELEKLSKWISLALLPTRLNGESLHSESSLQLLPTLPALDSVQAWALLCDHFGCRIDNNKQFHAPCVGETFLPIARERCDFFDSIEDLRKCIRCNGLSSKFALDDNFCSIILWASSADVNPFILIEQKDAVENTMQSDNSKNTIDKNDEEIQQNKKEIVSMKENEIHDKNETFSDESDDGKNNTHFDPNDILTQNVEMEEKEYDEADDDNFDHQERKDSHNNILFTQDVMEGMEDELLDENDYQGLL